MEESSIKNKSNEVTLNWHEAAMASEIGRLRHLSAIKNGRRGRNGFAGGGWQEHIEGACGELAVAKFLGIYWDGSIDAFDKPDVGSYEVRTRSKPEYELIVRTNSKDASIFICVTGQCPTYMIRGWIEGKDAKKTEFLSNHGGFSPAYFVPHSALMPMSQLSAQLIDHEH